MIGFLLGTVYQICSYSVFTLFQLISCVIPDPRIRYFIKRCNKYRYCIGGTHTLISISYNKTN